MQTGPIPAKAEEHIDQRDSNTVGERRINAFQFDHPEVHSFYKEAAADLMEELNYAERAAGSSSSKSTVPETTSTSA